eukprot:GDKH01009907.1.p1 GENE.GDKH01009907.1~~GDKH01009907.1.p1  ORF type:complete len:122 (-),score=5.23 GDKH01009907.1:232-597(-)
MALRLARIVRGGHGPVPDKIVLKEFYTPPRNCYTGKTALFQLWRNEPDILARNLKFWAKSFIGCGITFCLYRTVYRASGYNTGSSYRAQWGKFRNFIGYGPGQPNWGKGPEGPQPRGEGHH